MGTLLLICALLTAFQGGPDAPAAQNPKLRAELLRRVKLDQDARDEWIQWTKRHGQAGAAANADFDGDQQAELEKIESAVKKADAANTAWLKQVIREKGWPAISKVGVDGADAAWLLVQHADADAKFQRECLDLMARMPADQVSRTRLAYLTDRVLLAEGKKQVYGTQFQSVNGKWVPRELEDQAHVDERRSKVGLNTLAEYVRQLEAAYGPAPAK
ncbi:MAG TPA: DUF6624 domain-containing protein [Pirellulales bacterium]|jgi:Family of unknown function (DUF6624)|nr:DUF6624 domain-containing protein [Pirellulales bacterium]